MIAEATDIQHRLENVPSADRNKLQIQPVIMVKTEIKTAVHGKVIIFL